MEVSLPNGSVIHVVTPTSPHRLQGLYLSGGWIDDVNNMPDMRAFWLSMMARMDHPKVWVNAGPEHDWVWDNDCYIPGEQLPDNRLLELLADLPEGKVARPEDSRTPEQKEAIRQLREILHNDDLFDD
jgi:hypothetical protein